MKNPLICIEKKNHVRLGEVRRVVGQNDFAIGSIWLYFQMHGKDRILPIERRRSKLIDERHAHFPLKRQKDIRLQGQVAVEQPVTGAAIHHLSLHVAYEAIRTQIAHGEHVAIFLPNHRHGSGKKAYRAHQCLRTLSSTAIGGRNERSLPCQKIEHEQ